MTSLGFHSGLPQVSSVVPQASVDVFRALVHHLRENGASLRETLEGRIAEARLLTGMSPEEVAVTTMTLYDNYVNVLETGKVEALLAPARELSERVTPRPIETNEVVGVILLLRDVVARSLLQKYQAEQAPLYRVLNAFEPEANRIAITVSLGLLQERERVIRAQQEAVRELSTPVLQLREQLLILPIVGVVDPLRARQLTDQLLRGIRRHRAKVVIVDITGVPTVDAKVANSLVQAADAARLLGARVIVTGLSPDIAQTLVDVGVDLGRMNTVGDLQGGIEEAERRLGYPMVSILDPPERQTLKRG
jgi:rsbT co-antagonist protein RsbR